MMGNYQVRFRGRVMRYSHVGASPLPDCTAQNAGTKFVLRTCVDRLAEDGHKTIAAVLKQVPVKAVHRVEVTDRNGQISEAVLEIKYRRLCVYAPEAKQKHYGPLHLTVIYARERDNPKGRERIDWKLITNLPVRSRSEAIEKLDWYACRWKIELFHKVLKSGCQAEEYSTTVSRLSGMPAKSSFGDIASRSL